MNFEEDSDNSDFLDTNKFSKRKADNNMTIKNKLRIPSNDNDRDGELYEFTRIIKNCSSTKNNFNSDEVNVLRNNGEENSSKKIISETESESDTFIMKYVGDKLVDTKGNENPEDFYSCAVCLRNFDSENMCIVHMKLCAKKSKISPKQLLERLEIDKKGKVEGKSDSLKLSCSSRGKRKFVQEDTESVNQLALALALSKSLVDIDVNKPNEQSSDPSSHSIGNSITTLEDFGFKSSGNNANGGKKAYKRFRSVRFTLRERTQEERIKLVTEKAAVVLLNEKDMELPNFAGSQIFYCFDHSEWNNRNINHLWKLGENDQPCRWYVEKIKNNILDDELRVNDVSNESDDIREEIDELYLPKPSTILQWRKLVNNKHLSDICLQTKDEKNIFLHSVVIFVRCPEILGCDLSEIFAQFSNYTASCFLEYLYCGTLHTLKRSEVENLYTMARSLNFRELLHVLDILKKHLILKSTIKKREQSKPLERSQPPYFNGLCALRSEKNGNKVNEKSFKEISRFSPNSIGQEDLEIESVHSNGNKSWEITDCKESREKSDAALQNNKEWETIKENVGESISEKCFDDNSIFVTSDSENIKQITVSQVKVTHQEDNTKDNSEDLFVDIEVFHRRESVSEVDIRNNKDSESTNLIVLSGSSDSEKERISENYETNYQLTQVECDIPEFDPYEHFSSEIPSPASRVAEELNHSVAESQSLLVSEVSPSKSIPVTERNLINDGKDISGETDCDFSVVTGNSPSPKCSSTPIIEASAPLTSINVVVNDQILRTGCQGLRKVLRPNDCIEKNSKLSVISDNKSPENKVLHKIVSNIDQDTDKVTSIITESILKEFNNSMTTESKGLSNSDNEIVDTPRILSSDDYSEEVSPLPNYSVMGESSIKKHLSRYGLKKSLSRNKAKKILRHVYEELHPILNVKSGEIVKLASSENDGRSIKRARKGPRKKEIQLKKNMKTSASLAESKKGYPETISRTDDENYNNSFSQKLILHHDKSKRSPLKSSMAGTSMSSDSLDRTLGSDSYGSEFEWEQRSSQSTVDSLNAIYDFIHNNPDIRRKILMYQPIWLEDFRKRIFEESNKRYSLNILMDFLDFECISFRCENQRKSNQNRSKKKKSLRKGK